MRKARLILLFLACVAFAGDGPEVTRIHDVRDLKEHDAWWALAMSRVREASAQGARVQLREGALVVAAPAAVQERIAADLTAVRDAFSTFVKVDLRVATMARAPGVASVPEAELDAFLKERQAKAAIAPSLVCRNGDQAAIDVVREVAYVKDFDVTLDGSGHVVADPVVATLREGVTARVRPFVAGGSLRVAAEIAVTEIVRPVRSVELPYPLDAPLKVQVPETTTVSAVRLVPCARGSWSVIDLGSHVLFLRASPR